MKEKLTFEQRIIERCKVGTKYCSGKITRWAEKESLVYMKRFFSNPDLTAADITKRDFVPDAYQNYLPVIGFGITAVIGDDISCMLQDIASGHRNNEGLLEQLTSFEMAQYYLHNKYQPQHKGERPVIDLNPNATKVILYVVVTWNDIFKDIAKAIVIITDFMLENLVDHRLVANDLALKKLPEVVDFFHLDKYGAELLRFCYVFRASNIKLPRDVQNFTDRMAQINLMTGVPRDEIMKYTAHQTKSKFQPFIIETLLMQDNIWSYIANELSTDLESCFYKSMNNEEVLPREFFDEIDRNHTDTIVKILKQNTDRPRHILLYGAPGTGKTSYMKLLCQLSGRKGYGITQIDAIGNDGNQIMSVESRFMSVRICDHKIDAATSLIVVDEADEMINCSMQGNFGWFSGDHQYNTKSKSMLNQIMDEMKTPVIWITNNPGFFIDPSCRRRFDYSVYFDQFTEKQRQLIWINCLKRFGLTKLINAKMVEQLAADYAITPGGISMACVNIKNIYGGQKKVDKDELLETMTKILEQHCELLGIATKKTKSTKFMPCKQFSLDGLNIKSTIPLKEVEAMCRKYLTRLEKKEVDRSMCILLQGPSGTGKTEFVKYLGSVLKKPVEVVRGSTVLDMYVGNTEKNIAKAFEAAERSGSILFMDEIDGLIHGRDKAVRSWEVSQVNEILQQMESFRGIFIGATNFADNCDIASVRRFAFKFTFDTLKEDGIVAFYTRYFGKINPKDKNLIELKNLREVTPGDFSTVKMLSDYADEKITMEWVVKALKRELEAKKTNSFNSKPKPRDLGY